MIFHILSLPRVPILNSILEEVIFLSSLAYHHEFSLYDQNYRPQKTQHSIEFQQVIVEMMLVDEVLRSTVKKNWRR
jgi:hypothetical protein